MTPVKINLKTASLSILSALALSYARDIDRALLIPDQPTVDVLREELEQIFSFIPTARKESFQ